MKAPRPNRTREQLIAHLRQQKRLAAAEIQSSCDRVHAITTSLAALEDGAPITRCHLEDLAPEDAAA